MLCVFVVSLSVCWIDTSEIDVVVHNKPFNLQSLIQLLVWECLAPFAFEPIWNLRLVPTRFKISPVFSTLFSSSSCFCTSSSSRLCTWETFLLVSTKWSRRAFSKGAIWSNGSTSAIRSYTLRTSKTALFILSRVVCDSAKMVWNICVTR